MTKNAYLNEVVNKTYQHGFVTDIESDTLPPGLSEDVIRIISAKKEEPCSAKHDPKMNLFPTSHHWQHAVPGSLRREKESTKKKEKKNFFLCFRAPALRALYKLLATPC